MKKIIFIAGLMCAGKTTLQDTLTAIAISMNIRVQTLKFAEPLYYLQSEIYRLSGQPVVKNRRLMQGIGDAIRDYVGDDYFVKAMETAIARSCADIVIVDDMRFPIEMEFARKIGAFTVQIEAPYETRKRRGEALETWSETSHRTEQGLPYDQFGYHIANHGDMVELKRQALKLWAHLGIAQPETDQDETSEDWEDLPHLAEEHASKVDELLQSKFGISINDTNLEEKATENVVNGITPEEAVAAYADKYGLEELKHGLEGWG